MSDEELRNWREVQIRLATEHNQIQNERNERIEQANRSSDAIAWELGQLKDSIKELKSIMLETRVTEDEAYQAGKSYGVITLVDFPESSEFQPESPYYSEILKRAHLKGRRDRLSVISAVGDFPFPPRWMETVFDEIGKVALRMLCDEPAWYSVTQGVDHNGINASGFFYVDLRFAIGATTVFSLPSLKVDDDLRVNPGWFNCEIRLIMDGYTGDIRLLDWAGLELSNSNGRVGDIYFLQRIIDKINSEESRSTLNSATLKSKRLTPLLKLQNEEDKKAEAKKKRLEAAQQEKINFDTSRVTAETHTTCPACLGFVLKVDSQCRHCGAVLWRNRG